MEQATYPADFATLQRRKRKRPVKWFLIGSIVTFLAGLVYPAFFIVTIFLLLISALFAFTEGKRET